MDRVRRGPPLTAVVVGLVAVVVIGWPLLRLAEVALENGFTTVASMLGDPRVVTAIWNSLWTGGLVAILATVLGTAAAFVSERAAIPGRRWLRLGVAAPLVVPPFVSAAAWAQAYAPHGILDELAGFNLPWLYGPLGIVVVLAVAATPLSWLIVAGALASRVEPEVELAARASGAGPVTTWLTVTLPLIRPALVSALVVCFVFAVNAFGVPAVLGTPAGFTTITTELYEDLALSADPASFVRATTLALTLVVLAVAVVGSADALLGRPRQSRTGLPAGHAQRRRGGWVLAVVVALGILVTSGVPLLAIVLTALTRAVGLPPIPANWSLANFQEALAGPFAAGLATSLLLAVAAATIVLGLGALTIALRGRWRALGSFITMGFAVPGSALAVGVLVGYGGPLRDSLAVILIAYIAKFWALGHRQLAGSAGRLPADELRAARASGASALGALRSIVLPILRPSIVAAWLLVFIFSLHELTMSSLLYGPTTATLAVVVLNAQQLGDPTVTSALAVVLTGLVLIAAAPLALLTMGRPRLRPAAPAS